MAGLLDSFTGKRKVISEDTPETTNQKKAPPKREVITEENKPQEKVDFDFSDRPLVVEGIVNNIPHAKDRQTITQSPVLEALKSVTAPEEQAIEDISRVTETVVNAKQGHDIGADEASKQNGGPLSNLVTDPRFWVGAAPLLAGFISGYNDEGSKYAAQGYLEVDKRAREDQLLDRQLASKQALANLKKTGTEKAKQVKLVDDQGRVVGGLFHEETGRYTDTMGNTIHNPRIASPQDVGFMQRRSDIGTQQYMDKGGHLSIGKDDEGRVSILDKLGRSADPIQNMKGFTPNQKKSVKLAKDKYDKVVPDLVTEYTNTMNGLQDITEGNKFGTRLATMSYIKKIEQRMSDADREFYIYPFGEVAKLKEKVRNSNRGNLPPELLTEVKKLVKRDLDMQKKEIMHRSGKVKKDLRTMNPGIDDTGLTQLFPDISLQEEPVYRLYNEETGEMADVPLTKMDEAIAEGFHQRGGK